MDTHTAKCRINHMKSLIIPPAKFHIDITLSRRILHSVANTRHFDIVSLNVFRYISTPFQFVQKTHYKDNVSLILSNVVCVVTLMLYR